MIVRNIRLCLKLRQMMTTSKPARWWYNLRI